MHKPKPVLKLTYPGLSWREKQEKDPYGYVKPWVCSSDGPLDWPVVGFGYTSAQAYEDWLHIFEMMVECNGRKRLDVSPPKKPPEVKEPPRRKIFGFLPID